MASNKINIKSVDDLLDKLNAKIEEKKQNRIPQTVSELMPHIVEKIKEMKAAGFTDKEVQETLESVGVVISQASVRTYIQRYTKKAVRRTTTTRKTTSNEETTEALKQDAAAKKPQVMKPVITNNPAPLDDA